MLNTLSKIAAVVLFASALGIFYVSLTSDRISILTGISFILIIFFIVLGISELLFKIFKCSKNSQMGIRLLWVTLLLSGIFAELFLRFGVNRCSNYHEKNGSMYYVSLYDSAQYANYPYHTYPPKEGNFEYKTKEFTHTRKINSLGLAEVEIPLQKENNELRVICLGDSFTAGFGTSYESAWPKVFEKRLKSLIPNKKISVFNAGVGGSDVFFEYILLKDKLLVYKPDFVLMATNWTDILDIMIRGGEERFHAGGEVKFKSPPKWEWLYGSSYIVRHIVHDIYGYNWFLKKKEQTIKEERVAVNEIEKALKLFDALADEHGFALVVVFHPTKFELESGHYHNAYFHKLVSELRYESSIEALDLLSEYQTSGLIVKENASEYFWEIDRHHNTEGYAIMGSLIADFFAKKWLELSERYY